MRKIFTHLAGSLFVLMLTASVALAQSVTISGTVTDKSSNETLPGVSVTIKGTKTGTSTNSSGKFTLTTSEKTPFTLVVKYIGYETIETTVNDSNGSLNFQLTPQSVLGQEVVVSASRTPERILESPVTIERVSAATIREGANNSYYDALANLKGVESSSQSLTFRSINTRGFNSNGNVRVNQITDGMDNQAPGLNFSVGNIIGLSELDVESVELLPGSSSALYGSGGMNGTILMNSKNPFDYTGLSVQLRTGVNNINSPRPGVNQSPMYDYSFRWAVKSKDNKLAFKTSTSYLSANDWQAFDNSNFDRIGQKAKTGDRSTDPGFDGVNTYGDEVSANMFGVAQSVQNRTRAGILAATGNTVDIVAAMNAALPANATQAQIAAFIGGLPAAIRPSVTNMVPFYFGLRNNLIPDQTVSRTGYNEADLVDYNARSIRSLNALHYRINDKLEVIAQANIGSGTTVYTGSERYSIKNFRLSQYKLELKGENFFVRGYTTRENSGDSYNATALASFLNERAKLSTTWFPEYVGNYFGAVSAGATPAAAHATARAAADQGRLVPNTQAFNTIKEDIISKVIGTPNGGAKFADKSFLNQFEGMYNFSNALNNVVDLQVGAMYRQYTLNSNGTIFADNAGNLTIDEVGAFIQVGKKFFNDKLKLTAASRYDKSQNFEGRFTPRITGVFTVAPNNNIRASYQTGFRIPTTQNQYIMLNTGSTTLVGGIASMLDSRGLRTGIGRGYTRESVAAGNPVQYNFNSELRPESSQTFEIGYKGLITKNLLIDTYYYGTTFKDFISTLALLRNEDANGNPIGGIPNASSRAYGTVVNDPNKVKSYGFGIGVDYLMDDFKLSANVTSDRLNQNASSSVLQSEFNTPEWRYNLGLTKTNLFKNVGAGLTYRWQDQFLWTSSFITGTVESFGTLDAQVNFRIPKQKLTMKVGGSNITNQYYRTNFGNPMVGAVYYVSFTFDQLMK